MQSIIMDVNQAVRGWFEYFKHSWRTTFSGLDGWIRMREIRQSDSAGGETQLNEASLPLSSCSVALQAR